MANENCIGGTVASLQVVNTDCSCISISSITWNSQGTQFTITLNNGQSITSPVIQGAEGATPVIAFRVSGTMLQYNVDGGAWNNLIDLDTLVQGKNTISNNLEDSGTTTSSWETLGTASTDYTNSSKNLSVDGDSLVISGRFVSEARGNTRVRLNGSDVLGVLNHGFYATNINAIEYNIEINRLDSTHVVCVTKVVNYQDTGLNYAVIGSNANASYKQTIVVPDLASNNLTITAEADALAATADEIVLEYFSNKIYKKI